MLKRLIEVALPLKEVSEQSAREKSIRHGHISTLHIWWARRPLAACRAVVFASLIPDPDDPKCPESFRKLVMEVLGRDEFRPKRLGPSPASTTGEESVPLEDTPRNRCLEFIKHLVRWENSNHPDYIDPARKLISAAHKILHPDAEGDAPKVLDPFAGGGAIPLEALRLGCEAHAIDLNPVAHLIELCTLVYPQKYGQPNSRPVPDYIKRLIAHNQAKRRARGEAGLFDKDEAGSVEVEDGEIIPDVEITEAEYRDNPLAADLKYWGHWVLLKASRDINEFYPPDPDGSIPVAYLWARTVRCPNPSCGATIPCVRQLWLYKKSKRKVALRMVPDRESGTCTFVVVEENGIDFDPAKGTMQRGQAECPFCQTVANSKYLQAEGGTGRIGQQLMAVVTCRYGQSGKQFRAATPTDMVVFQGAQSALDQIGERFGRENIPEEPLKAWSGVFTAPLFGMTKWTDLFNSRQLLVLTTFAEAVRTALAKIGQQDIEYARALGTLLTMVFDRLADYSSTLCTWVQDFVAHTFHRQALPMIWDYCEGVSVGDSSGNWAGALDWILRVIRELTPSGAPCLVQRASATAIPISDATLDGVVTDPPYYDAVPYSDLSDYFYIWQKRLLNAFHPDVFRTPLTPKQQELVSHLGNNYPGKVKTANDYETGMAGAFAEIHRGLSKHGVCCVMFAHKTTAAWESLPAARIESQPFGKLV